MLQDVEKSISNVMELVLGSKLRSLKCFADMCVFVFEDLLLKFVVILEVENEDCLYLKLEKVSTRGATGTLGT